MRTIWLIVAVFASAPIALWLIMAVGGLAEGQIGFVAGLPLALFFSVFAVVCGGGITLALWVLERARGVRGKL